MIKKFSFFDTLLFNAFYSVPAFLQGIFTRSRFWVSLLSRFQIDRFAVRFIARRRKRYDSGFFSTRVSGTPTVIVLDHDAIKHVLANSPFIYADAQSKHTGMSHFQPNAVTISRGSEWKDRRAFNEAVLNTGNSAHAYAAHFLDIISTVTPAMQESAGAHLTWEHFDELFEQIASGVIFGVDPKAGRPLFERLNKMMRESNRVFGLKKSPEFDAFYEDIRKQLHAPGAQSLVSLCPHAPSSDVTRVENQIPHWMFAMRETLASNTARAMALIVSHPRIESQVREELEWSERLTPEVVTGLKLLRGCVQEAMRLWPTTPFIAREVIAYDTLGGEEITPGTQILILNTFNHRDPESSAEADQFCPEQWRDGVPDLPYNHLSSGTQVCAGKDLALFISTAVLAILLRKDRYALQHPALHERKPVPSMFNYFRLAFRRRES